MRLVTLLLLLAVAVEPATAAAQQGAFTARLGTNQLVAEVVTTLQGTAARNLRQVIDSESDADGQVTAADVDHYVYVQGHTFDRPTPSSCLSGFRFVRMGDAGPIQIQSIHPIVRGAEGPADSVQPLSNGTAFGLGYSTSGDHAVVHVEYARLTDVYEAVLCAIAGGSGSGGPHPVEPYNNRNETFSLRPMAGFRIDEVSVSPGAARSMWQDGGLTAQSDSERAYLAAHAVDFAVDRAPGAAGPSAWVVTASAATVAVAAVAFGFTEVGRYKLLRGVAAFSLFTRLKRDEVLEQDTRGRLYQSISQEPGLSFSDLRSLLQIGNGTLVHHLRVLEKQGFVRLMRDGLRTRFYVHGQAVAATPYLTRTQQAILDAIRGNAGATQRQLARRLGLPHQSVLYHARRLEATAKVRTVREGKRLRYYPA